MDKLLESALNKTKNIQEAKYTIYNAIEIGDPKFWLTSNELEAILNSKIVGESLHGMPLRTRSKVAKTLTCDSLGYPVPKSFVKCQPRFVGQRFDTYVQKSNNLQVWNEELDPERRYVLIRLNSADIITKVKVVTGSDLALLDTTGTLTQKYQAKLVPREADAELISNTDTEIINALMSGSGNSDLSKDSPISEPQQEKILSIETIFERIKPIIGVSFKNTGHDQERNRGGELHKIVCRYLGYSTFQDNGQFPDIKHQLLEVKLQTSQTIDLGLVTPDSEALLDIEKINTLNIRHCDVRYALFYSEIERDMVHIKKVYLTTGADFFQRFPRMGGKVLNKKIQIPLPVNFFENAKTELTLF